VNKQPSGQVILLPFAKARVREILNSVAFHHSFCSDAEEHDVIRIAITGSPIPFRNGVVGQDAEFPLAVLWISSEGRCFLAAVKEVRFANRPSPVETILLTFILQEFCEIRLSHPDIDLAEPGVCLRMRTEIVRIPPRDDYAKRSRPKKIDGLYERQLA